MKSHFVRQLILCGTVVAICLARAQAAEPRHSSSSNLTFYTNQTYGFVMACPPGWTFMTSREVIEKTRGAFQPTASAIAFCVSDTEFENNVNVQFSGDARREVPTAGAAKEFLSKLREQTRSQMERMINGFKLIQSSIVERAGGMCLDQTYETRRGTSLLQQRQVLLITRGNAFTITCNAKKAEFDSANRICFQVLLDSITVKE
jgi:hypothetical protein